MDMDMFWAPANEKSDPWFIDPPSPNSFSFPQIGPTTTIIQFESGLSPRFPTRNFTCLILSTQCPGPISILNHVGESCVGQSTILIPVLLFNSEKEHSKLGFPIRPLVMF